MSGTGETKKREREVTYSNHNLVQVVSAGGSFSVDPAVGVGGVSGGHDSDQRNTQNGSKARHCGFQLSRGTKQPEVGTRRSGSHKHGTNRAAELRSLDHQKYEKSRACGGSLTKHLQAAITAVHATVVIRTASMLTAQLRLSCSHPHCSLVAQQRRSTGPPQLLLQWMSARR